MSIFPNGMLHTYPMPAPTIAIPKYFTIYRERIEVFGRPTAFITPISRNSSEMVNLIVNFSTTNDTIIRPMLMTRITIATSVFMI